jgi:hypothetical protein
MPFYEYKVVPSPEKTPKARGLKGPARFANALQQLMNDLAQDGWEYQRAESLPDEERKGLTGRTEVTRHVLVFRRELYFEEEETPEETAGPDAEPPAATAEPDFAEKVGGATEPEVEPEETVPRFARRPLVADRKTDGTRS